MYLLKQFLAITIFIASAVYAQSALAASFYLSPPSGNISGTNIFPVQVKLNTSGEAINAISAFLSYPDDKLEVVWINPATTFSIQADNTYGGGVIKISRGNFSGVSGDVSIATIGFRGKKSGSATVAFTGGSAAPKASDSIDSLNLAASKGGVYNVSGLSAAPQVFGIQSTRLPLINSSSRGIVLVLAAALALAFWQRKRLKFFQKSRKQEEEKQVAMVEDEAEVAEPEA